MIPPPDDTLKVPPPVFGSVEPTFSRQTDGGKVDGMRIGMNAEGRW